MLDLNPQNLNISYLPWKDVPDAADYGEPGKNCRLINQSSIPYEVNLYQIDVGALISAMNFVNDSIPTTPALQNSLIAFTQYAPYGFQLYADNSSAFPYRDVIFYA